MAATFNSTVGGKRDLKTVHFTYVPCVFLKNSLNHGCTTYFKY